MPLPEPASSWAVLIGASDYDTLEPLPAVANNLDRLSRLLTDPDLWGLPAEHVTVLHNPSSRDDVLDAIHQAATVATDAIFVYFAGHGLPEHPSFALHLALPSSSPERLHRALPYAEVRREITKTSTARHKVVILDCCYSGQAMDGFMASSLQVADQAQIEGTYLMTASAETALALAVPGEEFTAFTGELVQAIEQGVQQGPELLDMGTLYFEVRANLLAKNRPEPQERARNDGRSIALLRNRWGDNRRSDTAVGNSAVYQRPEAPAGHEGLLRRPPREVLDRVEKLRADGDPETAARVLASVAGNRADQEVAATLQALLHAGREDDAAIVLQEAAKRPPQEVAALISVLRELGDAEIARSVIEWTATASGSQIVAVSSLLAHDWPGDARDLLTAAAERRTETQPMIDLIAALWAARMPDEIDHVLASATSRMSADEILKLADALRTTGREETAFQLYTHAASALAERSPDQIAGVVQAMTVAERAADAKAVVAAAAAARSTAAEVMRLADAMWAVGLGAVAGEVVDGAALKLPENQVGELLDLLYEQEHDAMVDAFCAATMQRRSATLVMDVVGRLRDLGRPASAIRLLASLGPGKPEETVPLVQALAAQGQDRDVRTILDSVQKCAPDHQAEFVATWGFAAEAPTAIAGLREVFRHQIAEDPQTLAKLATVLAAGAADQTPQPTLFRLLFQDFSALLAGYVILNNSLGCEPVARQLRNDLCARVVDAESAFELAVALADRRDGRPTIDEILPSQSAMGSPFIYTALIHQAMRDPGFSQQPGSGPESGDIGRNLSAGDIVELLTALRGRSPETEARVREYIARSRNVSELTAMVRDLAAADQHGQAGLLVKAFRSSRPEHVQVLARMLQRSDLQRYASLLQAR